MRTILLLLLLPALSQAQVVNRGILTLKAATTVSVVGTFTNQPGGNLQNSGLLAATADLENQPGATLRGNGQWLPGGDWNNSGTFQSGTSRVIFRGGSDSRIFAGGQPFYRVYIEKTGGADVQLHSPAQVSGSLAFKANGSHLLFGDFDLTMSAPGKITGANLNRHCVTGGGGGLRIGQVGPVQVLFPVGAGQATYNPLYATQVGVVDEIRVRCLENMQNQGGSGAALQNTVAVSWEIGEAVAGGSDLTLTAEWRKTDEPGTFKRATCALTRFDPTAGAWDITAAMLGASTGANPYKRGRSGLSSPGFFGVASTVPPTQPRPAAESRGMAGAENFGLRLSPVPACDFLKIEREGAEMPAALWLTDETGRTVRTLDPAPPLQTVDVRALPPGNYFIAGADRNGKPFGRKWVKI